MQKRYIFGLLSFLLFISACSASGEAVVSTTTIRNTTSTTADPESVLYFLIEELQNSLFKYGRSGIGSNFNPRDVEPHFMFATIEEIQEVLRRYGIYGNIYSSISGEDAIKGIQPQRELCDDWLLEELLAPYMRAPVGRYFSFESDDTTFTEGAVLAQGGITAFANLDERPDLVGLVTDAFAARGGTCKANSKFYVVRDKENWREGFDSNVRGSWWSEWELLKVPFDFNSKLGELEFDSIFFGPDSESLPGFRIVQVAEKRTWIRVFSIIDYKELQTTMLIELNIFLNGTSGNSPSINEFSEKYGLAFAELETLMSSKIVNLIDEFVQRNGPYLPTLDN